MHPTHSLRIPTTFRHAVGSMVLFEADIVVDVDLYGQYRRNEAVEWKIYGIGIECSDLHPGGWAYKQVKRLPTDDPLVALIIKTLSASDDFAERVQTAADAEYAEVA